MIVGLFPELGGPGGIQRAGRHTAAALARYAGSAGVPEGFLSLDDPTGRRSDCVGHLEFRYLGFGRRKARFVMASARLACARPRLVVAAHPNLAPVGAMMKLIAPRLRLVVVTYGIEVWTRLPARRRWALRWADLVVAPSLETVRCLETVQHLPEERIRCLPLGLDPEFAGTAAAPSRRVGGSRGFPKGTVILTVGRLSAGDRDKGIDVLIRAVARLLPRFPDLSLLVIGDGADRRHLEHLAQQLGVGSRVRFLGNVPADTLAAVYRRCDVFALPSRKEGFGLVFLEAMASGKPVIGGAHGGTLDIIEDGVTGYLVPHGDVEQLTQGLQRLLGDAELRQAMGRRGQERVLGQYRFEHFDAGFTAILDQVINGRRRQHEAVA